MPTKTIYVSDQDVPVFDEARAIAGETLSSIIARVLREFLARERQKQSGLKEISVRTGSQDTEREQRFFGKKIGDWRGFSDDREWWLQSHVYQTQKGNWAVHLTQVCKASLLTDKKLWKESGDYLLHVRRSDLFVATEVAELESKVPGELFQTLRELADRSAEPSIFLDI